MKVFLEDKILLGRPFKARRRVWAKKLEKVDTTKDNGYAFQGDWLKTVGDPAYIDDSVEAPCWVVCTVAKGSTRHPRTGIVLYRVHENGEVEEVFSSNFDTKKERAEAVQEIAKIVNSAEDNKIQRAQQLVNELIELLGSKEDVIKMIEEAQASGGEQSDSEVQ